MKNKVLLIFVSCLIIFAAVIAFLMWFFNNPNDEQYVAYRLNNVATEKYPELVVKKHDLNAYYKLADQPLINKYNINWPLAMTYTDEGRYDDALRVLDSFNPKKNYYGECWGVVSPRFTSPFAASLQRFACRAIIHSHILQLSPQAKYVKNAYLANGYYYLYYNKGDFKKALGYLEKIDTNFCGQAKANAGIGNFEKAEELYEDCSDDYAQLVIKGLMLTKQRDFSAAEETLLKAVEMAPTADEAYLVLAEMYKQSGQIFKSRDYARKALDIKPYSAKAKSYLAK